MITKRILVPTIALYALLAVLAACGGAAATPLPPETFTIVARAGKFDPNQITTRVNTPLTIILDNQDTVPHSFVIDDLNVKMDAVAPGQKGTVTFTPPRVRTYSNGGAHQFYSNVGGDKNSVNGNLIVNP